MATDINTFLTDSLILVGAYAQGQTANPEDLALAFRTVNRKIDSLSAEKLTMPGLFRLSFPLSGQSSYTMGPGMTWNTATRPIKIKSASVIAPNGVEKACNLPTADQWAAIPDKSRTGVYVEDLFYDNGFPIGACYVTPMPYQGNMILWSFQPIQQLGAQTGTVNLAPGYEQALLAVSATDLCIAFQRPLTQELAAAADQAKNVIMQLNAELFNAPAPPPAGPGPTSPPAVKTV